MSEDVSIPKMRVGDRDERSTHGCLENNKCKIFTLIVGIFSQLQASTVHESDAFKIFFATLFNLHNFISTAD